MRSTQPSTIEASAWSSMAAPASVWIYFDAGCNSMSAKVAITPTKLEVEETISTLMACRPANKAENRLQGFIASNPIWSLKGDSLVLSSGDKSLELRATN